MVADKLSLGKKVMAASQKIRPRGFLKAVEQKIITYLTL